MDIASTISVLLQQAPYLLFSILGLVMILFGSVGKFWGGEISQRDRIMLKRTGWIIFWLFLVVALIELISPGSLKQLLAFLITVFSSRLTWLVLVILSLCILALYLGIAFWRRTKTKKGYAINTTKVVDEPFISRGNNLHRSAGILVENTGTGDIKCVARLVNVTKLNGKRKLPIDIRELNPNGYYLRWDDGAGACIIKNHRPRKIDLADNYELEGFFREGRILFENEHSTHLETGVYQICIEISRISGNQQILMNSVEGVLGISIYYDQLPSAIYGEGVHVFWKANKREK